MTSETETGTTDEAGVPEDTDTPTAADEAEVPGDADTEEDASGRSNPSREAARYRVERNEARAERDALAEQLHAARTSLVEATAAGHGLTADALWAGGATVEQLLDEDGAVDPAKVGQAADTIQARFNLPRSPRPDPNQGRPEPTLSTDRFADAFAPE